MARTAAKSEAKAAKKVGDGAKSRTTRDVESRVIKMAEQIGWVAGTVQYQADSLMGNETLKKQMTMIRDGASTILEQVNRAGSAAGESASKLANAAKAKMPGAAARKADAEKKEAAEARRQLSRAPVAAPGKKHRKPPPQVKVGRHAGQAAAQRFVDKPMPNRQRRG